MSNLDVRLDPANFTKLNPRELDELNATVNAELLKNPALQKSLRGKVDAFSAHLKKTKEG
ncbi:MAG: hypothetical protein V4850_08550 [Myxococcota bacterium]